MRFLGPTRSSFEVANRAAKNRFSKAIKTAKDLGLAGEWEFVTRFGTPQPKWLHETIFEKQAIKNLIY